MRDNSISHILTERNVAILALEGPKISKKWPKCHYFDIWGPGDPLRQNRDISLCQYVRNWIIFHLRLVPSKQYWELWDANKFEKYIFEKIFGVSGIRPKRKKLKFFWLCKWIGDRYTTAADTTAGTLLTCTLQPWTVLPVYTTAHVHNRRGHYRRGHYRLCTLPPVYTTAEDITAGAITASDFFFFLKKKLKLIKKIKNELFGGSFSINQS